MRTDLDIALRFEPLEPATRLFLLALDGDASVVLREQVVCEPPDAPHLEVVERLEVGLFCERLEGIETLAVGPSRLALPVRLVPTDEQLHRLLELEIGHIARAGSLRWVHRSPPDLLNSVRFGGLHSAHSRLPGLEKEAHIRSTGVSLVVLSPFGGSLVTVGDMRGSRSAFRR